MSVGFSQSFPIQLSIISRALRAHSANPQMTKKEIAAEIGLNKPKMDGISAWLRYLELWQHGTGLLPIGKIILKYDEFFSSPGTKWLLHHTLVSSPSAEVWYFGFNRFFSIGTSFTREEFYDALSKEHIGDGTKYLKTDVGILINSYTDHDDAFSDINFFDIREKNNYIPRSSTNIPSLIFGYALYKFREDAGNVSTVSLKRLQDDVGQVGKLFMLGHQRLMDLLYELESLGIIRITQSADLENITYTYGGTSTDLLERYYNET